MGGQGHQRSIFVRIPIFVNYSYFYCFSTTNVRWEDLIWCRQAVFGRAENETVDILREPRRNRKLFERSHPLSVPSLIISSDKHTTALSANLLGSQCGAPIETVSEIKRGRKLGRP